MIGAGPKSWIGAAHINAFMLAGEMIGAARFDLVAGVFSRDRQAALTQARKYGVSESRVYESVTSLIEGEKQLDVATRAHLVVIVLPTLMHAATVFELLSSQLFHLVCDKPLTTTLDEALQIRSLLQSVNSDLLLKRTQLFTSTFNNNTSVPITLTTVPISLQPRIVALTHNYSGYPMIKQARELVASGHLGPLRKVIVEYSQQGAAPTATATSSSAATAAGAVATPSIIGIGTHAFHLLSYIASAALLPRSDSATITSTTATSSSSHDRVTEVFAEISHFSRPDSKRKPDNYDVLLRFASGARGILICSQSSSGEGNDLRLRVYGDEGGLEWHQESEPNVLTVRMRGRPVETWRRGDTYLCEAAKRASRLPAGHPEGYLEAFANIYANVARAITSASSFSSPSSSSSSSPSRTEAEVASSEFDFPNVEDAVSSASFVEAVDRSFEQGSWAKLKY